MTDRRTGVAERRIPHTGWRDGEDRRKNSPPQVGQPSEILGERVKRPDPDDPASGDLTREWLHATALHPIAVEAEESGVMARMALRSLDQQAENSCDACAGTGTPTSGGQCMCGGSGKMSDAARYLRERNLDQQQEIERLRGDYTAAMGDAVNLRAALEKLRSIEYACDTWKARAELFQSRAEAAERELAVANQLLDEANCPRKYVQQGGVTRCLYGTSSITAFETLERERDALRNALKNLLGFARRRLPVSHLPPQGAVAIKLLMDLGDEEYRTLYAMNHDRIDAAIDAARKEGE